MNHERRNRTPQISGEERREIRQQLRVKTDELIFDDIERCKSMRRHPFATQRDADYFTARILLARQELHHRLRKELEAL